MTETASFPQAQAAHVDNKEPPRSLTTAAAAAAAAAASNTAAGFQGKSQAPVPQSRGPSLQLHSHRQSHNASKLPSFRLTDIKPAPSAAGTPALSPPLQSPPPIKQAVQFHRLSRPSSFSNTKNTLIDYSPPANLAALAGQQADDRDPTTTITTTNSTNPAQTENKTAAAPATPSTPRRLEGKPSVDQSDSTAPPRRLRTRASSYQTKTQSAIAEQSPRVLRRPASVPESLAEEAQSPPPPQTPSSPSLTRTPSSRKSTRRPPASCSSHGVATSGGPPPSLSTQRRQAVEGLHLGSINPAEARSLRERDQGQGEVILLSKPLPPHSPPDASRDQPSNPPLVSHKSPVNIITHATGNANAGNPDSKDKDSSKNAASTESEPGTPATAKRRVPPPTPKRSSRLVNHRKSVVIDMNFQSRNYNFGGDSADTNQVPVFRGVDNGTHDFELAAASSPPASASQSALNNDDTGDVFLRIASEESSHRSIDDALHGSAQGSSQIRTSSSTSRRPQSTFMTSYRITSPPRPARRLSDHQELTRSPGEYEEEITSEVARSLAYRRLVGKAVTSHPSDEASAAYSPVSGLRPSPIAARPLGAADRTPDSTSQKRRRPSITENGLASPILVQSQHKTDGPSAFARAMGISGQGTHDLLPTIEGTESTGSTTGPSTVWDELDDLKSRIHRLELTGKLPPTSGAAVIKGQEDRPTTATTTMTTMSISPKKSMVGLQADLNGNLSSQKEMNPHHPNLYSALAKTKSFLSPEVYRALETAANDALALSSMMGAPGQPGPIASAVGGTGSGPVLTDRQLRRRADGVCRSLTELCISLNENPVRSVPAPMAQTNTGVQNEVIIVPSAVVTKSYSATSRRASAAPEQIPQGALSPRAISKFEERRNIILNNGVVSTPRNPTMAPVSPNDAAAASLSRRTSLLVGRSRRAGTEDIEDGRRSSMLFRARRTGPEEPEEGRKTSFLVRGRRGTLEDTDDTRFRTPSRATTEVNGTRALAREYVSEARAARWDESSQAAAPIGRHSRFLSTNLHSSRTIVPASSSAAPARKYIERSYTLQEANEGPVADKAADARSSRHLPYSQSAFSKRTNSVSSRRIANRDSVIAPGPSASGADSYR